MNSCVLGMSDLQLITGFAILISGYVQLQRGISAYNWQMLVYLAWFPSVTHYSALTFLRRYLYLRQRKKNWRLIAALLFTVMLGVAIIPTGWFEWSMRGDVNGTGAGLNVVCYLRHLQSVQGRSEPRGTSSVDSMITSMLLVSVSFLIRAIKIHRNLSKWLTSRVRKRFSVKYRSILKRVRDWADRKTLQYSHMNSFSGTAWVFLASIVRTMIYRSGLAVFLVLRITLDISTSVLSEVLWLIFSILWGTLRLVVLRSSAEGENNNWTFGQVLPLVSLAAPLVGVVEYFSPDSEISNDTSPPYSHMQNIVTEAASSGEGAMRFTEIPNETIVSTEVRDDLERDYYATAKWFKFVTVLMFCISLEIVIMNLLNIYVGNSAFPMSVMLLIALPFVLFMQCLFTLIYLNLESWGSNLKFATIIWALSIFMFLVTAAWPAILIFI